MKFKLTDTPITISNDFSGSTSWTITIGEAIFALTRDPENLWILKKKEANGYLEQVEQFRKKYPLDAVRLAVEKALRNLNLIIE